LRVESVLAWVECSDNGALHYTMHVA